MVGDKRTGEWGGYPETKHFDSFRKEYLRKFPDESCLEFHGTVKIHGANIAIVYTNPNTWCIHSRNRVLSGGKDLYGCFAALSGLSLDKIAHKISLCHSGSWSELVVVGEWAGKGIHKGVGVCQLDKFFTIFNIRIDGKWQDIRKFRDVSLPEHRIFNICDFTTYQITVDLCDLEDVIRAEKEIESYVNTIEKTCPVAAHFGINGAGEGLVFAYYPATPESRLFNFKAKIIAFDTVCRSAITAIPKEAVEAIAAFVRYAVTERRLDQGLEYLEEMQRQIEPKSTGVYIGWVVRDVLKEESRVLEEMGLSGKIKEVKNALMHAAREGWKVRLKAYRRNDFETEVEQLSKGLEAYSI